MSLQDVVEAAVQREMNLDFERWLEKWTFPGGCYDDAPDPPTSKYKTSPKRIAMAAIRAMNKFNINKG